MSGRAIAAYHSVLVFNVLGVSGMGEGDVPAEAPPETPAVEAPPVEAPAAPPADSSAAPEGES